MRLDSGPHVILVAFLTGLTQVNSDQLDDLFLDELLSSRLNRRHERETKAVSSGPNTEARVILVSRDELNNDQRVPADQEESSTVQENDENTSSGGHKNDIFTDETSSSDSYKNRTRHEHENGYIETVTDSKTRSSQNSFNFNGTGDPPIFPTGWIHPAFTGPGPGVTPPGPSFGPPPMTGPYGPSRPLPGYSPPPGYVAPPMYSNPYSPGMNHPAPPASQAYPMPPSPYGYPSNRPYPYNPYPDHDTFAIQGTGGHIPMLSPYPNNGPPHLFPPYTNNVPPPYSNNGPFQYPSNGPSPMLFPYPNSSPPPYPNSGPPSYPNNGPPLYLNNGPPPYSDNGPFQYPSNGPPHMLYPYPNNFPPPMFHPYITSSHPNQLPPYPSNGQPPYIPNYINPAPAPSTTVPIQVSSQPPTNIEQEPQNTNGDSTLPSIEKDIPIPLDQLESTVEEELKTRELMDYPDDETYLKTSGNPRYYAIIRSD